MKLRLIVAFSCFALLLTLLGSVTYAQQAAIVVPPGTVMTVELLSDLHSAKAKVDDPVEMRLYFDVKDASGTTLLHRGAKLTGKVLEVWARTKERPTGRIVIMADQLEDKDGTATLQAFPVSKPDIPKSKGAFPMDAPRQTSVGSKTVGGGSVTQEATTQPERLERTGFIDLKPENVPLGIAFENKKGDVELPAGTIFLIRQAPQQ